jgi:hypothetical protein
MNQYKRCAGAVNFIIHLQAIDVGVMASVLLLRSICHGSASGSGFIFRRMTAWQEHGCAGYEDDCFNHALKLRLTNIDGNQFFLLVILINIYCPHHLGNNHEEVSDQIDFIQRGKIPVIIQEQ